MERLTPILNTAESTLKMVDVIQQTHTTSAIFICIYQQIQVKYKDLNVNQMNEKMTKSFTRMKEKATCDVRKIMSDFNCEHLNPGEDYIFVKYRRVRDRVQPQVLIEIDFNKFL